MNPNEMRKFRKDLNGYLIMLAVWSINAGMMLSLAIRYHTFLDFGLLLIGLFFVVLYTANLYNEVTRIIDGVLDDE